MGHPFLSRGEAVNTCQICRDQDSNVELRTPEPTVPPHRVTIDVAPKNPVCSMAMSISIGQKLQPFTGNGDISM